MHDQLSIQQALASQSRPRIYCDFADNRFILTWDGGFDQEMNDLVKLELKAQFHKDGQTKYWWCARSEQNVAKLERMDATFTEAAQEAILWLTFDLAQHAQRSNAGTTDFIVANWQGIPHRVYQCAGVEYFTNCERGILADDMGTGKTITTLSIAAHNDAWPLLVISPAKLKGNWEEEALLPEKANLNKTTFLVNSASDIQHTCADQMKLFEHDYYCGGCRFDSADIVFTNYEQYPDGWEDEQKTIVKLSPLAQRIQQRKFKMVAYDEAHALKNWDSQRTKAVKLATRGTKFKLAITGTPVINDKEEACCLLTVTETIHHFGGTMQFRQDYITPISKWEYLDEINHRTGKRKRRKRSAEEILELEKRRDKELHEKLKSICMLRRTKKDVASELPPKVRQSFYVDIDNDEEYKQAKNRLLEWVRDRVLQDKKFMEEIAHHPPRMKAALIAQRQEEKEDSARRGEYMVRLMALRRVTAEGKLRAIKEWIDNFRKTGRKLLVFAIHQDILDQLLSWYPKAARILSSTKDVKDQVRLFQTDPGTDIFIGAMGTHVGASPAGTGHTLTAASDVITVELGFTAAHITQCEDRAHRIGSDLWGHESINIWHPLGRRPNGRNTIEVKLARIIDKKRELAERVVDGILDGGDDVGIMMALYDELLEDEDDD